MWIGTRRNSCNLQLFRNRARKSHVALHRSQQHHITTGIMKTFTHLSLLSLAPLSQAQTNRPAGTLVSWGCSVLAYEPGIGFSAVAAGGSHSLALKSDGSIPAWGWSVYEDGTIPGGAAPLRRDMNFSRTPSS